jgi:hypothetical protein
MVDLHWEITIESWVPDDQSPINRIRWFVSRLVGIGSPPLRAERTTATEVTRATAACVANLPHVPSRHLVKAVRHNSTEGEYSNNPPGVGSSIMPAHDRPASSLTWDAALTG